MKCPKCNQENPKKALSCEACGEPLPVKKSNKALVIAIVAVVLAAAIVAGIIFVPKILKKKPDASGTPSDVSFSTEENMLTFRYYYISQWLDLCSTTNQYIQYYGNNVLGYDVSKSPDVQESQYDKDDGSGKYTWGEYLYKRTCEYIWGLRGLYLAAVDSGLTLTAEDNASIKEQLESLDKLAAERSMTADKYLATYYGDGMTVAFVKKLLENQILAVNFNNTKSKEFSSAVTDAEIAKEYASSSDDYTAVSFLMFNFNSTDFTDSAASAQALLDAVDSDKDFFAEAEKTYKATYPDDEDTDDYNAESETIYKDWNKANLTNYLSEELATWAYADDRAVGDETVITTDSASFAVRMTELPHEYSTVSVRHILFKTTDDQQKPLSAAEIKAAEEKSKSVYDEWLAGDKTEDFFAELARKNSADSNADKGGIYEDISPNDMTYEFDRWCFDEARKPGDTGIVETDYGYHIMYFVKKSDTPKWKTDIAEELGTEKHSEYIDEIMKANSSYLPYGTQPVTSEYKATLTLVDLLISESVEETTTAAATTSAGSAILPSANTVG